jgi:transketolase
MEGVSYEALSLAGTLNLDNLIVLYDSNNNTLDSDTTNTLTMDVKGYVTSLGFDYFLVKNGNNVASIDSAITKAKKSKKPAFVEIKTKLGFGSDLEGKYNSHGLVMNDTQISKLRLNLGIKTKTFGLEKDVKEHIDRLVKNNNYANQFQSLMKYYKENYYDDYVRLSKEIAGKFSPLDYFAVKLDNNKESTRNIGGLVLNKLAEFNPSIIGGNADLSSCTKAHIKNSSNVTATDFAGRNIFYGVREFGMACITNGLALAGYKTYCGTFMVFSDYLRSAIRSSAIMNLPVVYVLSHDSIAVGEDGPTHQPV